MSTFLRIGQEIGTDGPPVLGTRLECEAISLWSQVIGQDSSTNSAGSAGSTGSTTMILVLQALL